MADEAMQSPVDIDAEDVWAQEEPGLGLAFGAIATAALLLALTNAISIRDWVDEQTPSARQAAMAAAADGWLTTTQVIGLATPRRLLHERWKAAQAARFGGG